MTEEQFVDALRNMTPAQENELRQWLIAEQYRSLSARDGRPLDVNRQMVPDPTTRPLYEAERIRRLGPFHP
jgi:hypothetical protein